MERELIINGQGGVKKVPSLHTSEDTSPQNTIYDSQREQALNFYTTFLALDEEGKNVGELIEETWQRLLSYAEEDKEEKLAKLRKELHDKIVKEEWQKNRWGN